jgi:protein-disulfide isomerase
MTDEKNRTPLLLAIGAFALLSAFAGYLFLNGSGSRAGTEKIVREYLLANPEIIPEAMAVLQKRETIKRLSSAGGGVTKPFPGAETGNPKGDVTIVEFTDYNCGYCKKSVEDLSRLAAEDKNLRVVFREVPVLSETSRDAALWALAAANQGKHNAFHLAMFDIGRPDDQTLRQAATRAGVDIAAAERFITTPAATAEIESNIELMRKIGFNGTPTFIIGDQIVEGAMGYDVLKKAVADARKKPA